MYDQIRGLIILRSDLLTLITNDVAEAVLKSRLPIVVLLVTVHVGYQVLLIRKKTVL